MRIAYVSSEFPPDSARGGIATYVAQVARVMAGRGHEVEVFAATAGQAREESREGLRIQWSPASARIPFRETILPVFSRRQALKSFDVVEGPEYLADAAAIKRAFPQLPLVVRMHTPSLWLGRIGGDYPPNARNYLRHLRGQMRVVIGAWRRGRRPGIRPFASWWRQMDAIEASHARSAEMVASPSRDLAEYAIERWKIPRARVRHIPYPYVPKPELLQIAAGTVVNRVGFIGRLEKRKGVLDLARAIPIVRESMPEVSFRFVGSPAPLPPSGEMADVAIGRLLGPLRGAVEFRGPVAGDSIPAELAEVAVCAFPSVWENFPNVCLEAMAAGRAIIGSSAGGMAEMLADGAGILVRPGDPAALAGELIALLRDEPRRRELGIRARQRVLEMYSADRIGALMESCYAEAIAAIKGTRRDVA